MHRRISDGVVTDSSCLCCLPGAILSGLYLCDRMHFIEATLYSSATSTGHSYTVNKLLISCLPKSYTYCLDNDILAV